MDKAIVRKCMSGTVSETRRDSIRTGLWFAHAKFHSCMTNHLFVALSKRVALLKRKVPASSLTATTRRKTARIDEQHAWKERTLSELDASPQRAYFFAR